MKIFEAKKEDIPLIQKLAEESWKHFYRKLLSPEQISFMLKEMYSDQVLNSHFDDPDYHYFLLENSGKTAGFMGYQHNCEESTTKLHRIYLLKEAQGTGLGKHAINFLKEKTAANGNKRIILNVNKQNRAKNFYESQGFSVYDEGVFDIGNGFVMDDYLMEFSL